LSHKEETKKKKALKTKSAAKKKTKKPAAETAKPNQNTTTQIVKNSIDKMSDAVKISFVTKSEGEQVHKEKQKVE